MQDDKLPERIVLTERVVSLGGELQATRTAYVEPSDGAEIVVKWSGGGGEDEVATVSLQPDDLDQLCMWWLGTGRATYRAFVRQYRQERGITPAPDDWIERTTDTLPIGNADADKG